MTATATQETSRPTGSPPATHLVPAEARFLNFPAPCWAPTAATPRVGHRFPGVRRVIEDNGGWPFHLLTEDIQFSVDCAIQGKRIGYCDKAVVTTTQPTTFRQSWDQRLRWSQGFYQVDREYTTPPAEGLLPPGRLGTSCYDMFVTWRPACCSALLMILFNGVILAGFSLTQPAYLATRIIHETVGFMGSAVWNFYVGLLFYGLIRCCPSGVTSTPRRQQGMSSPSRSLCLPTFPFPLLHWCRRWSGSPSTTPPLRKSTSWDKQRRARIPPAPLCFGYMSSLLPFGLI